MAGADNQTPYLHLNLGTDAVENRNWTLLDARLYDLARGSIANIPAGGDLTGFYPDPIIKDGALTPNKIAAGGDPNEILSINASGQLVWVTPAAQSGWTDANGYLSPTKGPTYPVHTGYLTVSGKLDVIDQVTMSATPPIGPVTLRAVQGMGSISNGATLWKFDVEQATAPQPSFLETVTASEAWTASQGSNWNLSTTRTGANAPELRLMVQGDRRTYLPNTLGLAVGAGTTPREMLDVSGAIILAAATAASPADGTLQYAAGKFQGRAAGAWVDIPGAGGGTAIWQITSPGQIAPVTPNSLLWKLARVTTNTLQLSPNGDGTGNTQVTLQQGRMQFNAGNSSAPGNAYVFLGNYTGTLVTIDDSYGGASEFLSVNGAITVGATMAATPVAGSIQWTGTNFQGYTGSAWINFGGGGGASLWTTDPSDTHSLVPVDMTMNLRVGANLPVRLFTHPSGSVAYLTYNFGIFGGWYDQDNTARPGWGLMADLDNDWTQIVRMAPASGTPTACVTVLNTGSVELAGNIQFQNNSSGPNGPQAILWDSGAGDWSSPVSVWGTYGTLSLDAPNSVRMDVGGQRILNTDYGGLQVTGSIALGQDVRGTPIDGTLHYTGTKFQGRVSGAWVDIPGAGGGGGPPSGAATGDLGGTYPAPTVVATHLAAPLPLAQGGTAATTAAAALTSLGAIAKAGDTMTGALAFSSGITFGSVTAAPANNLAKHLALFGTTYGFNVLSGALQVVVSGTVAGSWTSAGFQGAIGAVTPSTAVFTNVTVGTATIKHRLRDGGASSGLQLLTNTADGTAFDDNTKSAWYLSLNTAAATDAFDVYRSSAGGAPSFARLLRLDATGQLTLPTVGTADALVFGSRTTKGHLLASNTADVVGLRINSTGAATPAFDDATKSAWSMQMTTTTDALQVFRAPPGGGTPAFVNLLTLDNWGRLTANSDGTPGALTMNSYVGATVTGGGILFVQARGSAAAPTAVLGGDVLAQVSAAGVYSGASSSIGTYLRFMAAENWTSAARGTHAYINTTPAGTSAGPTSYLFINNDGSIIITGANAQKASGTTWSNPSDPRLKRDVAPYTSGLAAILALDPISFFYNGKGGTRDDGVQCYGYDATAVQPIFPECIGVRRGRLHEDDTDDTDILTLDTSNFTLALINAVKELASRVATLEAR